MHLQLGRNVATADAETVWVTLHEPWTVPLLKQGLQQLQEILRTHGRVLVVVEPLIDNPLSAEVRRYLADHQKDFAYSEIIVVSRSLLLRGVVALMHRARILLGGAAPNAPHFVRTADEARTLLASLRQKHQPKA
jgi:hypothetical protein